MGGPDSTLWTEKFFPKDLSEFLGNSDAVERLRQWGEKWEGGKRQKPLLLFGPTGTGKTCLAALAAQYFGWQLFEMNASDKRTRDIIEKIAGSAASGSSFTGKKRLILLDEVDGLQGNADRGGVAAINKVVKESKNPVILTANDLYGNQKMSPFRSSCETIQFKKIPYPSVAKRLREILESQKIEFDSEAIKLLAQSCMGDFRSALLDTQTLSFSGSISLADVASLGYRERQQDVFKTMGEILKGNTVSEIRAARFKADIDSRMLFNWIEENIPRHFTKGEDNANAFERLSKADIFNGRIMRRQHYGFLRYSSELMTSGVSLSRENEYGGWMKYQFPGLLRKLGSSKGLRNLKSELGAKIGKATHSSARAVLSYDLPFLKDAFSKKENAIALAAGLNLSLEETAFLMGAKPSSKKAEKVFEAAQEKRKKALLERRKTLAPVQETPFKEFEEPSQGEAEGNPKEDGPDEKKPEMDEPGQTRLF